MKVLIFTPVIKASAIGRMACLVTQALGSQGHDVAIVRTESRVLRENPANTALRDFGTDAIRWDDEQGVLNAAATADLIVYQVGDNYPFHEGCLTWLPKLPGVVCLHDFFLGHIFYEWAQRDLAHAGVLLRQLYGSDVANRFFKFPNNSAFIEGTRDIAPMSEWIASQALGVITHSRWGTPRVAAACTGPVRVVPLAYDAPGIPLSTASQVTKYPGRLNLLTIGYINRNKRADQVIRAIASSPMLRANVVYRLVGHINPEMVLELSRLANSLRVNLLISGEVDDETLAHAVAAADAMSCLRWPSLEGGSASAIESMLYRKPTMVTDTGFYAEIPNDCVVKIAHGDEVANIRSALEQLCSEPERREQLGERAYSWAKVTYSADTYARQLVDMSRLSQMARPVANAKAYFVQQMKRWGATEELLRDEGIVSSLAVMG